MTRAINILFQDGYTICIAVAPFAGTELESAREVLNVLQKYNDGIKRFRERKPTLRYNGTLTVLDFQDFIHNVINARKHVEGVKITPDTTDQKFFLDFLNNTITLYNGVEERGTMKLDMFYSNWESLFYKDELLAELNASVEEVEEETLPDPPEEIEIDKDYPFTSKMREQLDGEAFEVWNYIMNNTDYAEHPYNRVTIHYSGSGDSGSIDEFRVYTDPKNYAIFNDAELGTLVWNLIDTRESGFYNNDGGRGVITVCPTRFSWNHWNYVSEEHHDTSVEVDFDDKGVTELPF
jgi:hypothetical protein